MGVIPLASADKLFRKYANLRVTKQATIELNKALEQKATHIGQKAALMAQHSKRSTVLEEDINFVINK